MLSHLRESHKEEMKEAETTPLKEKIIVNSQPKRKSYCCRSGSEISREYQTARNIAGTNKLHSCRRSFGDEIHGFKSDLRYVQCCANVINIAVRAALESDAAKIAIHNVKKIVSKMNRSPKVKSLYKRLLKEADLPLALPVTDCPTRWGSTYTMVCDVLNSLPALENLLLELNFWPLLKQKSFDF
ncbi:hypothetical protein Aduo_011903 [Ancylostoma duodenale]